MREKSRVRQVVVSGPINQYVWCCAPRASSNCPRDPPDNALRLSVGTLGSLRSREKMEHQAA
jgi:hypothetical protein